MLDEFLECSRVCMWFLDYFIVISGGGENSVVVGG